MERVQNTWRRWKAKILFQVSLKLFIFILVQTAYEKYREFWHHKKTMYDYLDQHNSYTKETGKAIQPKMPQTCSKLSNFTSLLQQQLVDKLQQLVNKLPQTFQFEQIATSLLNFQACCNFSQFLKQLEGSLRITSFATCCNMWAFWLCTRLYYFLCCHSFIFIIL